MWLDNLKELKKDKGMTTKHLSDITKIPESTLKHIFAGDTDDPYVSTIHRIVVALGGSLDNILADTNAILAPQRIVEIKETAGVVEAERDLILAENAILKDKVATLTAELDMVKMQLRHKEELLAVHNYYNKLKSND